MELDEALERFRGPLVGLITSWGVPMVDAVELAEESFAEAHLNRAACRNDPSDPEVYGRWLRGVARNRFRNWLRANKRRERRVVSLAPETLDQFATSEPAGVASHAERVREAIDRLPDKQRRVVLMHYLEETSVREVALLLSVSIKTVEGRLYQARKSLKRMLADQPRRGGRPDPNEEACPQ